MKEASRLMLLLGCVLLFTCSFGQGSQSLENNIQKYDNSFDGIGPRVYILPPPKSHEEILLENYTIKWESLPQVEDVIAHIELEKRLFKMPEASRPLSITETAWLGMTEEQRLLAAIQYYQQFDQPTVVADLQNNLANVYFLTGYQAKAGSLYLASLLSKEQLNLAADSRKIMHNIAFLKEQTGEYEHALSYYQRLLDFAVQDQDIDSQAALFLAIANVEALQKNYAAAQQIGVQKSITLYKRTNNYAGIAHVLNDLAAFTIQQKKYVEAKWYYLQAIDVADTHGDKKELAISLYNLGVLKNAIQDYTLAIDDFKRAAFLADELSMRILLLKIKNGLGDSYLQSGDYTAALLLLNEFNILKSDFLQKD